MTAQGRPPEPSAPARRSVSSPTRGLGRAALGMAAGTTVSRLTGLLRLIALAYALGATHLADAYNLANTTPNMLYDIVLGGVLTATFIPVFVDRLATRSEKEAWRAISAVVTVSVVVLVVMTVIFLVLAPEVVAAYTAFNSGGGSHLGAEKAVATNLLRWFVPQVALYGFIALITALLNTRRRFAAPMWVPIANNLVVIGVLLWFHHLVPRFPSLTGVDARTSDLVLLGLGTTAGVALQALCLVPFVARARIGRLQWRFDPRHEAVGTVVRLGAWTMGFVVANQIALYVVLALAVGAGGPDPVSAYTYAYTFMQMPYAVVAVSIMSAVTPDLSEHWSTGDVAAFRRRMATGLRATLATILPAAAGMLVLARPAVALLLGHGTTSVVATTDTGASLALFSVGLPGFCCYLYVVRVLQSMQRTKVAFYLYLLENGLNVVLAIALVHPMGVRGLALSLSVAYTVAAAAGVIVLRRWLGTLGGSRTWSPMRRVAGATAVMALVVLLVSNASSANHGVGLLVRVVGSVVAGGAVYAGIGTVLGRRRQPLALFTGTPAGERTPTLDRRDVGAGAGLGGTAWGDPRVPVNPGPRVRIVRPPGSTASDGPALAASPRPLPSARRAGPATAAPRTGQPTSRRDGGPAPEPYDPAENADDPGERRWLGGTSTPLRPRRAR